MSRPAAVAAIVVLAATGTHLYWHGYSPTAAVACIAAQLGLGVAVIAAARRRWPETPAEPSRSASAVAVSGTGATRRSVHTRTIVALATAALAVGAAGPAEAHTSLVPRDHLAKRVLTQDGADTYAITKVGSRARATAPPTNHGINQREVFWTPGLPDQLGGTVCASWDTETSPGIQQGLALAIVAADGHTRAVTVTKNVVFGITWVFNLHVWDTRAEPAFTGFGQHDMGHVVSDYQGGLLPLPWRLCARLADGQLTFKLWVPRSHTEPGWDDPWHTRSAPVPADWNVPGQLGWYVGHIPPGGNTTYTDLS